MSEYTSIYDPMLWDNIESRPSLGGRARARTAKRHPSYKFFLPDNVDTVSLPDDYKHGKAGGDARKIKAKRDNKGRFLPD